MILSVSLKSWLFAKYFCRFYLFLSVKVEHSRLACHTRLTYGLSTRGGEKKVFEVVESDS